MVIWLPRLRNALWVIKEAATRPLLGCVSGLTGIPAAGSVPNFYPGILLNKGHGY